MRPENEAQLYRQGDLLIRQIASIPGQSTPGMVSRCLATSLNSQGGITVRKIQTENNAEVRRVMIERYGWARYLQDSGAQKIHEDELGEPYRADSRRRARWSWA